MTSKVRAKFDYAADGPGELTMKAGDIITVLERDDETGWHKGESGAGLLGYFPSNFTEPLAEEEAVKAEQKKEEEREKQKDAEKSFGGAVKLWVQGVWVTAYGRVDDAAKTLNVYDQELNGRVLKSVTLREAVKRGAPSDVQPPPGEDNCQFAVGTVLLSAPDFSACGEWITTLKSYNTTVQLARISVKAREDNEEALSPSLSAAGGSPNRPASRRASTLRGRLGSLRGGSSGNMSPTGSPDTRRHKAGGGSPRNSPSIRRKEGSDSSLGNAIDAVGKKAAELLFRRKERKERKEKRDVEDDNAAAWPTVGQVKVPAGSPEAASVSSPIHKSSPDMSDNTVKKVSVKVPISKSSPSIDTTAVEKEPAEPFEDQEEVQVEEFLAEEFPEVEVEPEEESDDVVCWEEDEAGKAEAAQHGEEEQAVEDEEEAPPVVPAFDEAEMERQAAEMNAMKMEIMRLKKLVEKKNGLVEKKTTELTKMREKAKNAVDWANQRSKKLKDEAQVLREEVATTKGELEQANQQLEEAQALEQQYQETNDYNFEQLAELEATIGASQEETARALQELRAEQGAREKAETEAKLTQEAMTRQKNKIEILMEEKLVNRGTINDLREQLDSQLQAVFTENAKTGELEQELAGLKDRYQRQISTAEAKSKELASLQAVADSQKERVKILTEQTDKDSVQITTLQEEQKAQAEAYEKQTQGLEEARSTISSLEAELAEVKETSQKQLDRLKRSVDAVSSGRGRLEQLEELQTKLENATAEFEEERERLENEVASLSAENETLAESNEQLIAALEGQAEEAGENGGGSGAFSVLEIRGLEERVAVLERENSEKQENLDEASKKMELLGKGLLQARGESEDRAQKIYMLVDRVRGLQKEQGLLQDALDTNKAAAAAQQSEAEAQHKDDTDRIADLERRLEEEKQHVLDLEAKQAAAKELAKEFDKFQTRAAASAEEAAADSASIRTRLNEAIQERYRVQADLDRLQAEAEKKTVGVSLQDFAEKERQFKRRIQDLEGELKRSKMDKGSNDTKQRLAAALEESAKLTQVTKKLAAQVAELEEDLALSEQACDDYEELIRTLQEAKSK